MNTHLLCSAPGTHPAGCPHLTEFGDRLFVLRELSEALRYRRTFTSRDGLCAQNTRYALPATSDQPTPVRGLPGEWGRIYRAGFFSYVVLYRNEEGDWPLAWVRVDRPYEGGDWVFPELRDTPPIALVHQSLVYSLIRYPAH